jgi:hypothetical protein
MKTTRDTCRAMLIVLRRIVLWWERMEGGVGVAVAGLGMRRIGLRREIGENKTCWH